MYNIINHNDKEKQIMDQKKKQNPRFKVVVVVVPESIFKSVLSLRQCIL